MKRCLDIAGSLLLLLCGAPLLLACALAVRLSAPGPIFFSQRRLGLRGRVFLLHKFRTMIHNAPDLRNPDGSAVCAGDDPRVTRIGRFLRQSSLDELPQLWNVLRGDMSLVGPRPDLADQLSYYTPEEYRKLDVKPGLTGLAQIGGRNRISWAARKQLDIAYVETHSVLLDCRILLLTIPYVLRRRDVNAGTQ